MQDGSPSNNTSKAARRENARLGLNKTTHNNLLRTPLSNGYHVNANGLPYVTQKRIICHVD